MIKWIKKLRAIVTHYDANLRNAHSRIAELEGLIRERTNIAVDVGFKSANHVIVIGRYKNVDYIQTYTLDTQTLATLIDHLRQMAKYGDVCRVDAPPALRAVFERDRRGSNNDAR